MLLFMMDRMLSTLLLFCLFLCSSGKSSTATCMHVDWAIIRSLVEEKELFLMAGILHEYVNRIHVWVLLYIIPQLLQTYSTEHVSYFVVLQPIHVCSGIVTIAMFALV